MRKTFAALKNYDGEDQFKLLIEFMLQNKFTDLAELIAKQFKPPCIELHLDFNEIVISDLDGDCQASKLWETTFDKLLTARFNDFLNSMESEDVYEYAKEVRLGFIEGCDNAIAKIQVHKAKIERHNQKRFKSERDEGKGGR